MHKYSGLFGCCCWHWHVCSRAFSALFGGRGGGSVYLLVVVMSKCQQQKIHPSIHFPVVPFSFQPSFFPSSLKHTLFSIKSVANKSRISVTVGERHFSQKKTRFHKQYKKKTMQKKTKNVISNEELFFLLQSRKLINRETLF
jgi:hypothetical protein